MAKDTKAGRDTRTSKDADRKRGKPMRPPAKDKTPERAEEYQAANEAAGREWSRQGDEMTGRSRYDDDENEELDKHREAELADEGDGLRRPQRSDRSRGR